MDAEDEGEDTGESQADGSPLPLTSPERNRWVGPTKLAATAGVPKEEGPPMGGGSRDPYQQKLCVHRNGDQPP